MSGNFIFNFKDFRFVKVIMVVKDIYGDLIYIKDVVEGELLMFLNFIIGISWIFYCDL